jgi:hypothetical protein
MLRLWAAGAVATAIVAVLDSRTIVSGMSANVARREVGGFAVCLIRGICVRQAVHLGLMGGSQNSRTAEQLGAREEDVGDEENSRRRRVSEKGNLQEPCFPPSMKARRK